MSSKKEDTSDTHVFKPSLHTAFNKSAEKPTFAGRIMPPDARRVRLKGKKFVITSAQNNTEVHPGFLTALETYCKENDAQLLVVRFSYNKNAFLQQKEDDGLWYDPRIMKYAFDQPAEITKDLVLCGELDILPTAVDPLSGFDNYCQGASGIIAHPKIAMKSLPGVGKDSARFMYTTGACTQRNYIQRKAGQKAEFHHNFGALVVEVDKDGDFFVRQLAADNSGAFQDLTEKYTPEGKVLRNQRVEAVNLGDVHVEKSDPVSERVAFAKGGIMDMLKPKYMFIHDMLDFTARNHHNIKDPFFWAQQRKLGNTVEGGIDLAAAWLKAHARKDRTDVIVESNHDTAYERWMRDADVRFDPVNARFWHESCAEKYRQIENGNPEPNMLEWAIRRKAELPQAKFLREGDSFVIAENDKEGGGIECGLHGHTGANGSRGSPKQFRSVARKVNTGHTHSAGIVDGVYTAGVHGSLDQGYNKGPSSWSHSHIVTYPNGKRTIITVKDGKWKADSKVGTLDKKFNIAEITKTTQKRKIQREVHA